MTPTDIIRLPAFQDNYVWAIQRGDAVVAVDPGDPASLMALLTESNLRLTALLLTHHHYDHIDGVAELTKRGFINSRTRVYGPPDQIPYVNSPVAGGDLLQLPGLDLVLSVMDVPGHTADHVAYFSDSPKLAQPALFCGDTLFSGGCGRLLGGTASQLLSSLDTIRSLPDATAIYCAHEYTLQNLAFAKLCDPDNADLDDYRAIATALRQSGDSTVPSRVSLEKRINPFLRVDKAEVKQALSSHLGRRLEDRLEVFTEMRRLKDGFRAT